MSDPTVESITKAMQTTSHYRLPLDLFCETLLKKVSGLRDENAILRAALEQFVAMPEKFPEADFLDGWARMRAAFSNAKAVLQPLT